MMAQKAIKELWAEWMERSIETPEARKERLSPASIVADMLENGFGILAVGPTAPLDNIIERLELALTDVKTLRDNLVAEMRQREHEQENE